MTHHEAEPEFQVATEINSVLIEWETRLRELDVQETEPRLRLAAIQFRLSVWFITEKNNESTKQKAKF